MAYELYRDGIFLLIPKLSAVLNFAGRSSDKHDPVFAKNQKSRATSEELPVKLGENYPEIERVHGCGKGNAVAIAFLSHALPWNFSSIDYGVPMSRML